jgi:U3 small nucleolar RNA-associated protein 23
VDVHGRNKHRYVVATQDVIVRRALREVVAVPLVYVEHGVTKLEPMAQASEEDQVREEKRKFRDGIKTPGHKKRKSRDDADADEGGQERETGEKGGSEKGAEGGAETSEPPKKKKKQNYGRAKGANPLSVMKKKKRPPAEVGKA